MFVTLEGLTIKMRVDGPAHAPALLLLHALGTSSDIWDGMLAALTRNFRVIRPDMRGHGLTEVTPGPYTIDGLAADAFTVMDFLNIERAHVAGVSIGGLIAQSMALRQPERLLTLTLIATAPVFPNETTWRERAHAVRSTGLAPMAETALERWITGEGRRTPAAQGLRQIFLRTDPEGYAAACEALAHCDLSDAVPTIKVPSLILVGAEDPATPVATAQTLVERLPSARLIILPRAAHIPTVEQPEAVASAMLAFLKPSAAAQSDLAEDANLLTLGMSVRRAVLGDSHVDTASADMTDVDSYFQTFITRTAWGQVWARPHFDRRTRSIVTLALLAGLGCEAEFAMHVRASRATGCTDEDISELLLHVAVYAGIPRANAALHGAKETLAALTDRVPKEPLAT